MPPRSIAKARAVATRTRSARATQSASTKEAILESCLRLFAKHGFVSTSMDMIAGAAGLTKGAVYWHFDSKDALFAEILGLIRARWQQAVMTPVAEQAPPTVRLERLFRGYARLFTADPDVCFFLQAVLLERDDVYSPQIARVFKQTAKFIAGILDEGRARGEFRADLDSAKFAHSILASIAGVTQQHLVNPTVTIERLLEEACRMTLGRIAN